MPPRTRRHSLPPRLAENPMDEWAVFTLNFGTRGPAAGERMTPLIWRIVGRAAYWAQRRNLVLDRAGRRLVLKLTGKRKSHRRRTT